MICLTEPVNAARLRLGERLIACGLLTESQLEFALDEHFRSRRFLGETVVDLGLVDELHVGRLVADDLGIAYRDLRAHPPQAEAMALVSSDTVFATRSIPTRLRGDVVEVAMVDPLNRSALKQLTYVTGRIVVPHLTLHSQWEDVVSRHFPNRRGSERTISLPVEEWREIGSAKLLRRGGVARPNRDNDRERLFEQLQPLVRRLMRRYGRTSDLREDLRGEIYLQFCQLYERYDPSRRIPLHAYMIRMLTAGIHTYARRVWQSPHGASRTCNLDAVKEISSDPTANWDDQLEFQTFLRHLPEAIAELPHRQRKVLISRYYCDSSFEEIAVQMEIQPATARSLLRHAINALRLRILQPRQTASSSITEREELRRLQEESNLRQPSPNSQGKFAIVTR